MSLNTKIITTYSKSLFQIVKSTKVEKKAKEFEIAKLTTSPSSGKYVTNVKVIAEELLLIRAMLVSSDLIKTTFNNPTYAEKQKLGIIFSVFPGLSLAMKSFLEIIAERGHLYLLPEICEEYQKILLKFKNATKVKITLSSPLPESFGESLLKSLKKLTKASEIFLIIAYNPKLLGGLIIEYNSLALDASILKEFSLFFSEI
jgi:F-type H+-transporting ATPase subunit delta